jgi:hypothetical protein
MTSDPASYLQRRAEHMQRIRLAGQAAAADPDDPSMVVLKQIEILQSPIEITINYRDAAERATTRTIQVRRYDGHYISALCLLRQSYRTFLVDRVEDAFDADGVVIDNLHDMLALYYGPDSLLSEARERQRLWRHILSRVAPELLLLRLLAAADGKLSTAEGAVISEHALRLLETRDISGERDTLLRFIGRLSGTQETVAAALAFMQQQSKKRRRAFGEACLTLVQIDGDIDDEEMSLLRWMEESALFG